MPVLKHVDLLVLALALGVFVAAGLPLAGFATGAVAWIAQKFIKELFERRALAIAAGGSLRTGDPERDKAATIADMRRVAGLTAGSMIGRGWLSALVIFAGYFLAGQDDGVGLAAAVLVLVCFTASFTSLLLLRPFNSAEELPS